MKNEITITVEQLAKMLAVCIMDLSEKERYAKCSTFRWMLYCIESDETAERFYDMACDMAKQIVNKEKEERRMRK